MFTSTSPRAPTEREDASGEHTDGDVKAVLKACEQSEDPPPAQQSRGGWDLPARGLGRTCKGARSSIRQRRHPEERVCISLLRSFAQSTLIHVVEFLLSNALLDECFLFLALSLVCQKVLRFLNDETIVSTFQEFQVIQQM